MVCLDTIGVDAPGSDLQQIVGEWISAGVTGVVGYNDDIAARVARASIEAGFVVPDDLSVIGHDDSPIASLFLPALSSVRLDNAGLGRLVAEMALAAIEQRESPHDTGANFETIVARASTAPPPPRF